MSVFYVLDPSGRTVMTRGGFITVVSSGWRMRPTGHREYKSTHPMMFARATFAKDFAESFGPGSSVESERTRYGAFTRHIWDGRKWRGGSVQA